MKSPKICASITSPDAKLIKDVEPLVDFFEVRIDMIGDAWLEVVKDLKRPWIACNRTAEEGGQWHDSEARRVEKLLHAMDLGANVVDIELRSKNLGNLVAAIKKRAVGCLVSYHDMEGTPSLEELRSIAGKESEVGADICKLVTTACGVEDNWTMLRLVSEFHDVPLVSFAMGPLGVTSRLLSPLAGGYFTYASLAAGKESAPGQVTVDDLASTYRMLGFGEPE